MKISTAFGKLLHRLYHDDETTELPLKIVENFRRRVYVKISHDQTPTIWLMVSGGGNGTPLVTQ
ncbi:MAG: hypothetical protein KBD90_04015 [Alphaproteobacteria bacterium]|nr:hypothetical protein [Alphaproteobacteria bacterium]